MNNFNAFLSPEVRDIVGLWGVGGSIKGDYGFRLETSPSSVWKLHFGWYDGGINVLNE